MAARLPKSMSNCFHSTDGLAKLNPLLWRRSGIFFGRKMGLLVPPHKQPIAGYCAAGRNNRLFFLTQKFFARAKKFFSRGVGAFFSRVQILNAVLIWNAPHHAGRAVQFNPFAIAQRARNFGKRRHRRQLIFARDDRAVRKRAAAL
ncbi:MAG: hypothetical protein HDKAJFGB_03512 [Anaerolineae bacterium]|nr:hypothetical protein [Anaerolineae bacterium]